MGKRIGPVQRRVLDRAGRSALGNVMPAGYLERRAIRRLERRGFLKRALGFPGIWRLS